MGRNKNRGFGCAVCPNYEAGDRQRYHAKRAERICGRTERACGRTERACGRTNREITWLSCFRITALLFVFALAVTLFSVRTEAASATLSVSATGAQVGETVDVTVSVKSDAYIGYVQVIMSYDATILQAPESVGGGSGTIVFLLGSENETSKEYTTTIAFTALKAGTSPLTIDSGTWGIDDDFMELTLTTSDASVTVEAAYTASTDATLSSLKVTGTTDGGSSSTVTLSPSFSKNTTAYTATVDSSITTAVTTAAANDSKASVSISDASLSLKTGVNTVTVKVTAESGATKTYTVTITRKEAETTTQETTTQETTTEETTTEETTTEEETTTGEESDPILVTIDGEQRILLREFDETLLPEGFETAETAWEDEVIQTGQGIYKDLTLVCTSDMNGENLRLYILEGSSFLILRNYQTNAVLYTILNLPGEEAPAGFQLAALVMETDYASEDEVEAWQSIASPDYYLVYAMNWDGETGYYLYDSLEKTLQRYDSNAWEGGTTEAPTEETTTEEVTIAETSAEPTAEATPVDATPTDGDTDGGSDVWKYVIMLLEAVAIVVLAALLIRAKRSGGKPDGGQTGGDGPAGQPDGGDEKLSVPSEGRSKKTAGASDSGEGKTAGKSADKEEKAAGASFNGDRKPAVTSADKDRKPAEASAYGEGKAAGVSADKDRKPAGEENSGGEAGEDPDDAPMSLNEYFSDFDAILAELEDKE